MRFLLILFFPRLSKASSLNFILCALCPSPLSILLAAFWTLYHLSMSLLYQGTPNWTHYFMQCLLSVKGRRIVTFFDLLALLFLIHSSMQMDLFLPQGPLLTCSTCCSPGLPAPFLVTHHQASWLQPVLLHGVNPAQVQDLHFPLLNFKRFLMAHFSSLSRSWMAALPSSVLTTLPNLISSANLLRVLYRLLPK